MDIVNLFIYLFIYKIVSSIEVTEYYVQKKGGGGVGFPLLNIQCKKCVLHNFIFRNFLVNIYMYMWTHGPIYLHMSMHHEGKWEISNHLQHSPTAILFASTTCASKISCVMISIFDWCSIRNTSIFSTAKRLYVLTTREIFRKCYQKVPYLNSWSTGCTKCLGKLQKWVHRAKTRKKYSYKCMSAKT